ncbi:hypothetical protein D3C76_1018940 [compost metagenome]
MVEVRRQLACLRQARFAQARSQLPARNLAQGAQQFIQQAHGAPYRPADGQQAQQQGQATQAKQLLQGVPDFVDLIPRIDSDQHPAPVIQVQQPAAAVALAKQLAAQPGIQAGLRR